MTRVNIYRVDALVQAYAKETSSNFKKLEARYKRILKSKRFQTAFPKYKNIGLEAGSGGGSYAHFYSHHGIKKERGWMISLGGNRSEAVLLHEIAHHVARLHPEFGYCGDHGPGFASALLAVVKVTQGVEAERALKHTYKAIGVKVYKAGKRNGVAVRVRGEVPESAQEVIGKIVGWKKGAADNRAFIRAAMEAARADFGEQSIPCPSDGCDGQAEVQFGLYHMAGYRSRVEFTIEHKDCDLLEWTKVRNDWWQERRAEFRRVAAHS
jgi:hypothetical protein